MSDQLRITNYELRDNWKLKIKHWKLKIDFLPIKIVIPYKSIISIAPTWPPPAPSEGGGALREIFQMREDCSPPLEGLGEVDLG